MSEVAKEYGTALFSLTQEEGLTDALTGEITCVRRLFDDNPGYAAMLATPGVTQEERRQSLAVAFADVHPYLLHFLFLLTERGYAREIPAALTCYLDERRQSLGIAEALVESAVPLSPGQKDALCNNLRNRFGKTVELTERVVPSLLGGARVYYEGHLLDGTVRTRLDGLRTCLDGTVL